jgi:hypothetical protein
MASRRMSRSVAVFDVLSELRLGPVEIASFRILILQGRGGQDARIGRFR